MNSIPNDQEPRYKDVMFRLLSSLHPSQRFYILALVLFCSPLILNGACSTPTPESQPTLQPDTGSVDAAPMDTVADTSLPTTRTEDVQEDTNEAELDIVVEITPLPDGLTGQFNELSGAYWDDPDQFVVPGNRETKEYPKYSVGLFSDLNGDGVTEVIISPTSGCTTAKSQVFSLSEEGDLVLEEELSSWLNENLIDGAPVAILDYNGDGALDLLTTCSQSALHLGNPEGGFDPPQALPLPGAAEKVFHYAGSAGLYDLDEDGLLDLLIGDKRCAWEESPDDYNLHPVLNLGNGTYEGRTDLVMDQLPSGDPYAVMAAPVLPNGETLLLMIGRPCTKADPPTGFFGFDHLNEEGYPVFSSMDPTPFNSLYKSFISVSFGPLPQISPMAASVTDINGDGKLDTTISVSPGNNPYGYLFFQGTKELPWMDRTLDTNMNSPLGELGNYLKPWGTALIDLDGDGRPDHVATHGDDAFSFLSEDQAIGPQWTTFHWNQGGFQYTDITEMMGPIKEGNWYSLTVGDLESNGTPDFIAGGQGHPPEVFHNALETPNGRLALRLKGSTSNHLGIGATVQVFDENEIAGRTYLMGQFASPRTISEPIVYLGIGEAELAHRVLITWPSGLQQQVEELERGQVHMVEEPPLISLGCSSRHVPADGSSTCSILVTPRNLDGTYNPDAEVSIDVAYGHKDFVNAIEQSSEGWTRVLQAPSQPGSSVVQVKIDGVPVRVRPRIWWD